MWKSGKRLFRILELVLFLALCCLCMSGCVPYPEWGDKFIMRYQIYGLSNGVRGNFGLTCTDGEKIYYYDDYVIYSYEDGQAKPVVQLDKEKDSFAFEMACTPDYLYYELGSGLCRVDLHTKKVEHLDEVYGIDGIYWMTSHEDDVFIQMFQEDAENKEWMDALLYIGGDGTTKVFPVEEGEQLATIVGSYRIAGRFGGYDWQCLSIRADDGWQYSGGSNIVWEAGDNTVRIYNCNISLNEKQIAVGDDIRYDGEEWYASTEPEFCSVYGDEVYLLYEYRDRDWATLDEFKGRDAIYRLDTDTGELELVYQVDAMPTQIATYSVEKGVVYLLKLDGLYRVDVDFHDTNDPSECTEEKILKLSRKWRGNYRVAFSECGGKLFVFDDGMKSYTKLLKVIEQ